MKRLLAVLIIASFATTALPVANAAETVTEEYFTTAGVRVLDQGRAVSWRPCPSYNPGGLACDPDGDGTNDVPDVIKMGGGPLQASEFYTNVIVRVNDEVYGAGASVGACFWHPDGDNVCEDGPNTLDGVEDYPSDRTCGTAPLLGSPFASDSITVWVHTLWVSEDGSQVCGGFAGTMTGDFF